MMILVKQVVKKFLRKKTIHSRILKILPEDTVLGQFSPGYSFTTYFSMIRFNIIVPSTSKSSEMLSSLLCFQTKVFKHLPVFPYVLFGPPLSPPFLI
jgi:hypothetical protein